jgi:HEAT repeat protein
MPETLNEALNSDCGHSLDDVLTAHREEDFIRLLEVVAQPATPEHRLKALHLLALWGDRRAVAPIRRALPGLAEIARARAIDALGRLGGPEALEVLLAHTSDPSPQVRKFVVHGLRRSNDDRARVALNTIASGDPADFVRALAGKPRYR